MSRPIGQGTTRLRLGAPPVVHAIGVAVHGTRRRQERWLLPELYSFHMYRYHGRLDIGGVPHDLRHGVISVVAPAVLMDYHFDGPSEHLYAHFSMPSDGDVRDVSTVQDMMLGAPGLFDRLQSIALRSEEARRSAELWAVLWRLADTLDDRGRSPGQVPPAVVEAMRFVESNLAADLTVRSIAAAVRFSPSHLNRLFLTAQGVSLSTFVRQRRMASAEHLLRDTSQSIPLIAASIGMPDLQTFNKACRRWLGASPRALRNSSRR